MTDFEREDMELKFVMGEKFQDVSEAKQVKPKKAAEKPSKPENPPAKSKNFKDALIGCVKWAMVFGGLNMLVFYWQLEGLMAESIAIPSMWVCCALAGYGVGVNIWRAR